MNSQYWWRNKECIMYSCKQATASKLKWLAWGRNHHHITAEWDAMTMPSKIIANKTCNDKNPRMNCKKCFKCIMYKSILYVSTEYLYVRSKWNNNNRNILLSMMEFYHPNSNNNREFHSFSTIGAKIWWRWWKNRRATRMLSFAHITSIYCAP